MGTQQFCLRWNNHQTNLLAVFDQLLQNEAFVDVTLACEGLSIKAHKMVLSACSPYFQSLFLDNPCQHPIVILKDMRFSELKAVVDFMYKGEVNVSQDQLSALLKTAETLKVKGLAEVTGSSPPGSGGDITRSALGVGPPNQGGPPPSSTEGRLSPPPKRKRGRPTKRPSTDGEQLEVVESLVDVVPDGPDSVPPAQERSTEQSSVQGMELLTDAPTTISDHAHNTSEMAYDGPTQEQNSRDSSMILADQTQSSSSSLGHLPATASTSGMSPGQALHPETSPETVPVKDEPFENLQVALSAANLTPQTSLQQQQQQPPQQQQQQVPPPLPPLPPSVMEAIPGTSSGNNLRQTKCLESDGKKSRVYQCKICHHIYYNAASLSHHMNVHNRRFFCNLCQKAFTTRFNFNYHMETHTPMEERLKKYKCPHCKMCFTLKYTLQQHLLICQPKGLTNQQVSEFFKNSQ